MSFLLKSESGTETGWTHFAWPIIRRLAEDLGWRPRGTQPPIGWDPQLEAIGQWDGRYTTNDGQLVAAEDALALATALEAALESCDFDERIQALNDASRRLLQSPGVFTVSQNDISSWRNDIEHFVRFCRSGSFRVF